MGQTKQQAASAYIKNLCFSLVAGWTIRPYSACNACRWRSGPIYNIAPKSGPGWSWPAWYGRILINNAANWKPRLPMWDFVLRPVIDMGPSIVTFKKKISDGKMDFAALLIRIIPWPCWPWPSWPCPSCSTFGCYILGQWTIYTRVGRYSELPTVITAITIPY